MSEKTTYIPSAGDIIIINFGPSAGKEIQKRRPALVVSDHSFNKRMEFAIVLPITSSPQDPLWSPQVSGEVSGWVCTWQARSLDYEARRVKFVEKADPDTLEYAKGIIKQIVDIK